MDPHLKHGSAPTILPRNDQNRAKTALFVGFLVGTPPLLRWGCISPRGIDRSTQDYKRKCFWKYPTGRDVGAYSISGVRDSRDRISGAKIGSKGGNSSQKSVDTIYGLKIWRKLWFCYQTWPSSIICPNYKRSKLSVQKGQKVMIVPWSANDRGNDRQNFLTVVVDRARRVLNKCTNITYINTHNNLMTFSGLFRKNSYRPLGLGSFRQAQFSLCTPGLSWGKWWQRFRVKV